MIVGIWLSSLDFGFRSPSRLIEPSLYPLKQKLLINEKVYDVLNSDTVPAVFARNMPQSEESFEFVYTSLPRSSTFDQFAEEVFQFGITESYEEPYMYSSFEIFQADK